MTSFCQDGGFLAFPSIMERHTFDMAKTKKSHNTRSPLITIISLIMSPESPYVTLGTLWKWLQFCTESKYLSTERPTVTGPLTWTPQVKLLQWRGIKAPCSCKSALSSRSVLLRDLLYSCFPEPSRLILQAVNQKLKTQRNTRKEQHGAPSALLAVLPHFFFPFASWSLTSPRATGYCSDSDKLFWSVTFCLSAAPVLFPLLLCL